jgi:hypothetical protein
MFCSEYIKLVTGKDVTNGLRAYDEPSASRIVGQDLVSFASGIFDMAGINPTDTPMRGDVGVIEVRGAPTCAIKTQDGWALKTSNGVLQVKSAVILAAWEIK